MLLPKKRAEPVKHLGQFWVGVNKAQLRLKRNAMAIFQDLADQHGFAGQNISVKRFIAKLRHKEPEQFDRLSFLPGEEMQVDLRRLPAVRGAGQSEGRRFEARSVRARTLPGVRRHPGALWRGGRPGAGARPQPQGHETRLILRQASEIGEHAAEVLQAIVHQRYKLRRSIVITSNRVLQDWGKYLGDATMASTILDRLMHRCTMLEFEGRS